MNRADRRKTGKTNNDRLEEYVDAGLAIMEAGGDLQEAQRQFRQALVVNPQHPRANLHMGNLEMWARRYGPAQEHFSLARQADPENATLISNLALALHEQGLAVKALPLYEEALGHEPNNPVIRTNLARALWNTGDAERAQDEAKRSLEIDADQGIGWLVLGSIQRSLNLLDAAVASITRAIKLLPGHMEANFLLARLLFDPKDPDACLKPSEETYDEMGDGTEAAMCRAELLFQSGNFAEAEKVLARNLEVENPSLRLNILNVMANTQQRLGKPEVAIEFHKKALQISMDHPTTRYHYGRTLAQSGDYAGAITQFQSATQQLFRDQSLVGYLAFTQKMVNGDENMKRDVEHLLGEKIIAPKEVFGSIVEMNDAVLTSLNERKTSPVHSFDRSRRITGEAWESVIGSAEGDAVVVLGDLLRDALIEYLTDLPQGETEHPFLIRTKFGMGAMETWAETLNGTPATTFSLDKTGWFRAIYFVSVPEACADEDKKQGWLRLGVPDFGDKADFTPDAEIKPEAGKLIVFPAYYWAGFNELEAGDGLTYIGINGQSRAG